MSVISGLVALTIEYCDGLHWRLERAADNEAMECYAGQHGLNEHNNGRWDGPGGE